MDFFLIFEVPFSILANAKRLRCIENLIDDVMCEKGPSAELLNEEKDYYMHVLSEREKFYRNLIRPDPCRHA